MADLRVVGRSLGLIVVLSLVTSALPAAAQQPVPAPEPAPYPPVDRRVKIGVGLGAEWALGGGGGDTSFLVTAPVNDRYALEGFGGKYHGSDIVHTEGVYGVQVKRVIDQGRQPGVEPFVTFGAMGVIANPERHNCSSGKCVAYRSRQVYPPIVFLTGVGAEFNVKSHLIVRTEFQGGVLLIVPVNLRAAVTVAIPLGRVQSSSRTAVSK